VRRAIERRKQTYRIIGSFDVRFNSNKKLSVILGEQLFSLIEDENGGSRAKEGGKGREGKGEEVANALRSFIGSDEVHDISFRGVLLRKRDLIAQPALE
jgi:hypothetical protein